MKTILIEECKNGHVVTIREHTLCPEMPTILVFESPDGLIHWLANFMKNNDYATRVTADGKIVEPSTNTEKNPNWITP